MGVVFCCQHPAAVNPTCTSSSIYLGMGSRVSGRNERNIGAGKSLERKYGVERI
jgi:hypothetical protein